jgi:hypothetical protein
MVLVKLVCFGRSEGCVVVASKDARFESTSVDEEADDAVEVVEESVLIAGLDGVAEEVFTSGVLERDELLVPFYALWVDGANVVVADAFADGPLVVLARVGGVVLLDVLFGVGDG